ncbi:MAG: DotA/TraY family protein [Pseudomonadota bacterium]
MTANTQSIDAQNKTKGRRARGVLRYLFMPEIIPNIKELTKGGFGFLAFLIAYVYQGVRILPANHPFTNSDNLGTFTVRQVIAEAANHVKLDKNHLDQVIIFFAILAGIILVFFQFISLLILMFSGTAFAQTPDPLPGLFETQFPETDIAFHLMREVFGIPDFFGPLDGGISAFHTALHGLFMFYNMAILVVAIVVFVYYVIVVVTETAATGTPFGQRFSHIYAPLRLVIAIGLLVPLNYGLNASQWITLYAAKLGSSFATTGWIRFNDSLADSNPLGADNATLISPSKAPDIEALVEFMSVVHACKHGYRLFEDITIEGRVLQVLDDGNVNTLPFGYGAFVTLANANYSRDIKIQFGYDNADDEWQSVCGEVTVPITVPLTQTNTVSLGVGGTTGSVSPVQSGDLGYPQEIYYRLVQQLWIDQMLDELGEAYAEVRHTTNRVAIEAIYNPDGSMQETIVSPYRTSIEAQLLAHYQNAADRANFNFENEIRIRGWGGAGIWYNRIAQMNGGYVVATMNAPNPSAYPDVMQEVLDNRQAADRSAEVCERFNPNQADNQDMELGVNEMQYAIIMDDIYQYWTCDNADNPNNFFIDTIAAIFGLEGLINIRETATDANGDVVQIHPLAKLSALGKGLVESAIRNLAMSFSASVIGGAANILAPQLGAGFIAASQMFTSIAVIGLSIGFITFYILPFLPFIYFFFALGGWVKGIFEAMVGAPLWALAHLRIDGEGIPGKMAMNGYFLIFEIFIRPILTVFGLIGGMAIFSAMATILNELFDLVVLNTANVDLSGERSTSARQVIDVFFFTVVYAIILYMMAMASFKMITLVPNSILRWLGQSVSAFNDNAGDPAANLTSYAAIGGNQIGGKLAGGLNQAGQAIGGAGGGAVDFLSGGRFSAGRGGQ